MQEGFRIDQVGLLKYVERQMFLPVFGQETAVVLVGFNNRTSGFARQAGKSVSGQAQVLFGKVNFRAGKPQRVKQKVFRHSSIGLRHLVHGRKFGVVYQAGVTEPFFQLLLALADIILERLYQLVCGFTDQIQTKHDASWQQI